jgi:hypothetical protein
MRQPLTKPPIQTALQDGDAPKAFSFAWIQWWNQIVTLFAQTFRGPVRVSGNYSANPGDVIFADTSSGDVIVQFPSAASSPNSEITVTKISADANRVILLPSGTDLIQYAISQVSGVQWNVFRYSSDNVANWFPV